MKLLIIQLSDALSGAEKRFLRIFRELVDLKHDVKILLHENLRNKLTEHPEFNVLTKEKIYAEKTIFIKPKCGKTGLLFRSLEISKRIKSGKFTHVHTVLSGGRFIYLGKSAKISFEVTSPDVAENMKSWKTHCFDWQYKTLICVSPSVEKVMLESPYWQKRKHKLKTSPIPFFKPDPRIIEKASKTTKEKLIVCASRFIPRKNVHLVAQALADFLPKHPEWRAEILGFGPMEDELKEITKDCDHIFIGYRPNIYESLCKSKIFVSIIERDNYPSQSILEAMICRNVLVLSNRGDSNRFSNGKNTIFIQPDKSELIYNLTELINDNAKLESMQKESLEHASISFSYQKYLDAMLQSLA